MKHFFNCLIIILFLSPLCAIAQQQVTVISRCGGVDTLLIPSITDHDHDAMDDALEQKLLEHFMPITMLLSSDNCPGPALDGSGDSNLVVCHIYPYPQQYTFSSSVDSIKTAPVAIVPAHALTTGLIWYQPLIKVNCAWLYGRDCGLLGHTADVEGFNYTLRYIGTVDSAAGWMYDTVMSHWMGGTIQSVSHAGTACEQVETYPYKSALFPNGLDTVYSSPDKHGNYLTISECGASIICNPGCGGAKSYWPVRAINLGEPNATLVADLGTCYAAYAGNDPWGAAKFLSANGGNAGTISEKMLKPLTTDYVHGYPIGGHNEICGYYAQCYGTGYSYSASTCQGHSYLFAGQHLSQAGTYYQTLTSSYGCDSLITLHLSVVAPSNSFVNASFCSGNTYNFNGQTLQYPGTYNATIPNSQGCDSNITLYLTRAQPTSFAYSDSMCVGDIYNLNGRQLSAPGIYHDTISGSNGCDSMITLTLSSTQLFSVSYTASVCSGNNYNFNGQQLNTAGTYTDTLHTGNGCDSIVHLLLSIDPLPTVMWSNNTDSIATGSAGILLTGATPMGGTYTGTGVTNNIFYPDSAGPGTHSITYTYTDNSGCSDIATRTFIVTTTGMNELSAGDNITIYPDPAQDVLQITYTNNIQLTTATLYDMRGADVMQLVLTHHTSVIDVSALPRGSYFIRFRSANGVFTRLVMLQ